MKILLRVVKLGDRMFIEIPKNYKSFFKIGEFVWIFKLKNNQRSEKIKESNSKKEKRLSNLIKKKKIKIENTFR